LNVAADDGLRDGNPNQLYLNQTPDLDREMTDPYVIERIKAAFVKDKSR